MHTRSVCESNYLHSNHIATNDRVEWKLWSPQLQTSESHLWAILGVREAVEEFGNGGAPLWKNVIVFVNSRTGRNVSTANWARAEELTSGLHISVNALKFNVWGIQDLCGKRYILETNQVLQGYVGALSFIWTRFGYITELSVGGEIHYTLVFGDI